MVLACQGQLRLAPSGHIIGIDMDAALRIGAARGPDLAVLSELLPAAEAGLLKGRSERREHQAPVPVGRFQHRRPHDVAGERHRAERAPRQQHGHGDHHVQCLTNDTAWHTLVATWRPRRLELYLDGISRANSTAANTNTSDAFGIYRWGWGFSTNQDFNGDIALILCCGACWTGHMVRRWHADPFGFLRPWNEVPALMGSAPPATPPSTGTGVVTFLMG